jgi:hypothetical protein
LATPGVVAIAATANDTMVVAGDEVGRFVTLRNVSIKNGEVSGEIVNNSRDTCASSLGNKILVALGERISSRQG